MVNGDAHQLIRACIFRYLVSRSAGHSCHVVPVSRIEGQGRHQMTCHDMHWFARSTQGIRVVGEKGKGADWQCQVKIVQRPKGVHNGALVSGQV